MQVARRLSGYTFVPNRADQVFQFKPYAGDLDRGLSSGSAEEPWSYQRSAGIAPVGTTQERENDMVTALQRVSRAAMFIGVSMLFFEGFVYNTIYIRTILPAIGGGSSTLTCSLVFNSLWFMAIWSYMRAHSMSAGMVPQQWHDFVACVGKDLRVVIPRTEWQVGIATHCKKCGVRPERAHHCNVCDVCVLRMDHHCPWINNCVGLGNHKVFLLLAIYACAASVCALITSFPAIGICITTLMTVEEGIVSIQGGLLRAEASAFIIFFLVAVAATVCLLALLRVHFARVTENVTSIEDHFDNMANPFDQGSVRSNLEQTFGAFGVDWFFPIAPWPLTDGVSFQKSGEEAENPWGIADEGGDKEALWRIRYHAHTSAPQLEVDEDASPMEVFKRWWNGRVAVEGHDSEADGLWDEYRRQRTSNCGCYRPPKGARRAETASKWNFFANATTA
jgi:palmitoyltransferase